MKTRLDQLLVQRGLAPSRERAQSLIIAGAVLVNGQPAGKAGTPVAEDADVTVQQPDHPYVGRGGLKLAHALDTFGVTVDGREALDIGASTGGFTDVLLRRGATRVVAYDVGNVHYTEPRATVDAISMAPPRTFRQRRWKGRTLTLRPDPP